MDTRSLEAELETMLENRQSIPRYYIRRILQLFVGQVNAILTPFRQRDTRIKRNLIN